MFNELIALVSITQESDSIGQVVDSYSEKEVFALKKPIMQNEFFQTRRSGIKAVFCFEIHLLDYDEETLVRFNGNLYQVYRTYPKFDTIEIYCNERGGISEY